MATNKESQIKILNSQSAGATPDVSQMEYGELAINTADDKLFYKRSASGIGTISARDPYMGLAYEYKTAGVTAGTTGGINIAGNTFSIHSEDLSGNDASGFLDAIKEAGTGLIYWAAEDRDKTMNVMSYVTAGYKASPDDNVLTLNGSHLVSNALSDGDLVRVVVSTTGVTAEGPGIPSSLKYRFIPDSTSTNSSRFTSPTYLSQTGQFSINLGYEAWPDLGLPDGFYPAPFFYWFNTIDADGVDASNFFKNVGPGDTLELVNLEEITSSGVTYKPGEIIIRWVNTDTRVDGSSWSENAYIGYYDAGAGDTGDVFWSQLPDQLFAYTSFIPSFGSLQLSESQQLVNDLCAYNYPASPTTDDGLLFSLTRIPAGGGGVISGSQREFNQDGSVKLIYGFTGAAPANNGEVFIDYTYLPTTQFQIHKFGQVGEDNRQIFSDLTNSKSLVSITRKRGYTAGVGSAYATLTVGPSSYVGGTYWTFDVLDAITGGTGGTTSAADPNLSAGDLVSITITPQGSYNNVETFNGSTGDVEGVSSVNGQTGGVTAGYIHIGATAPASPTEMDFWFETDTGSFYAYIDEGGGAAWVEISADPGIAVTSVNGATGDVEVVSSFNGSTGAIEGVSSVNGSTGAITNVAFTNTGNTFTAKQTISYSASGSSVLSLIDTSSNKQIDLTPNYFDSPFISGKDGSNTNYLLFNPTATSTIATLPGFTTTLAGLTGTQTFTGLNTFSNVTKFSAGISMDTSGITFPDGSYQSTAATSITDYVSSFNGSTGAVEGVSTVNGFTGGVTAGGVGILYDFTTSLTPSTNQLFANTNVINVNETSRSGIGMTGAFQHFADAGGGQVVVTSTDGQKVIYAVDVAAPTDQGTYWRFIISGGQDVINTNDFSDGEPVMLMMVPNQDNKTITSSYAGHIYSPSEGTYYLDPRAPTGRTITEFYAICGTGGISADLYNAGATVGSINVSTTGATASLSNTSLAQDASLELVTSNYSACYDFRFAVRYTQ